MLISNIYNTNNSYIRMFRVTSAMVKFSCRCYCLRNLGRLASYYHYQNWNKMRKKKYNNLRGHENSAIDIVADKGSPVIITI